MFEWNIMPIKKNQKPDKIVKKFPMRKRILDSNNKIFDYRFTINGMKWIYVGTLIT